MWKMLRSWQQLAATTQLSIISLKTRPEIMKLWRRAILWLWDQDRIGKRTPNKVRKTLLPASIAVGCFRLFCYWNPGRFFLRFAVIFLRWPLIPLIPPLMRKEPPVRSYRGTLLQKIEDRRFVAKKHRQYLRIRTPLNYDKLVRISILKMLSRKNPIDIPEFLK